MGKLTPIILLSAIGALAAPASALNPTAVTVWFPGDQQVTADRLEAFCAAQGARVVQRSDKYMRCQRDADIAAKMIVQQGGNAYAGSTTFNFNFVLTPDRGATRVETTYNGAAYEASIGAGRRMVSYPSFHPKVRRDVTASLVQAGGNVHRPAKL